MVVSEFAATYKILPDQDLWLVFTWFSFDSGGIHAVRGRRKVAAAEGGATKPGRTEDRVQYPFPPFSSTEPSDSQEIET